LCVLDCRTKPRIGKKLQVVKLSRPSVSAFKV
jgi:hypothetical protein